MDLVGLGAVLVGFAAVITSLGTVAIGLSNGRKLDNAVGKTAEIHSAVNSNLDKLRMQFYGAVGIIAAGIIWVTWDRGKK